MPQLTIDGKGIEVAAGTTVIQAAEQLGIFIPRYCYHPGLSIAGNCRICLVAVQGQRKLQIACNTPAADGMVVQTNSDDVEQGRQSVLEFLLANHPLDCPVCDQSGECDLQNFYLSYGRYDPRFQEQKVKKPKAVPIGPTVMLDAERCVLCSRCERFTDEVSKSGELGIFNRGDKAEIGIYPGRELNNPYAGNVVDICPVGALTDRDFRFKSRVWYLSTAPSVCPGCSRGCNIDIHYVLDRPHLADGARVMRLKPRTNPDVNQWWICDEGRYGYKFIDQARLTQASHKGRDVTWETAWIELSEVLSKLKAEGSQSSPIAVLPSAQLTTEELYLIRKLFQEGLGAEIFSTEVPEPRGTEDDFLIQADKNPNSAGAELVGLRGTQVRPAKELTQDALAGKFKLVWVFGHDLSVLFGEEETKETAKKVDHLVFQGSNENKTAELADWVLPSAVYAEKNGTFVNCEGRIQQLLKAFEPLKGSLPDDQILRALADRLEVALPGKDPESIFLEMAEKISALEGLDYKKIGDQGLALHSSSSRRRGSGEGGFPLPRE